jgi:hypothetical protein
MDSLQKLSAWCSYLVDLCEPVKKTDINDSEDQILWQRNNDLAAKFGINCRQVAAARSV